MKAPLIVFALLLTALLLYPVSAQGYQPPHENPGPAVDRIIFRKYDQDLAPKLVERGEIDLYLFNLRVSIASEYLRSEKVRIYEAPSTTVAILMNPAPAPEGQLNPFSIKEVRKAVQHLVDREYIAEEIYRGFAEPMYSHVSPLDYDYLVVSEVIKEVGYSYDPDYAKSLIEKAMLEAGAELVNGKWSYGGKPIELKFIIRVEDERREIGNMLAEELERMGFTVRRMYKDFAQAISIVYRTDPAAFEWHLYTEGWGRASIERYDYATLNQMCAPWLGYMPGWLEVGYWQYENKALDELGQRLFKGEYMGLEERNRLYAEATRICMDESIRAWVAVVKNALPATVDLRGVSADAASGLRSIWTLRSTYVEGGELRVGHLWVRPYMGSAWNPVGGFTDVYSVDIWRLLHDPPIWRHPFTGVPMPFRANYTVETAGPNGWLKVPEDAFIWDAGKRGWAPVGEGVKARSKVTFDYSGYLGSRWHHGAEISWSDILYTIYHSFDLVYNPEKSKVEVALAAVRKPILDTFKGFKIVGEDKLEVYVDYWHFDPNYIAEYAEPWGAAMPWELLYAMDVLVFGERKAAYSDTAAARLQVDWLNLIESGQARKLVNVLKRAMERGEYPVEVFEMKTSEGTCCPLPVQGRCFACVEEAEERYEAAIEWFQEHGHLVVSNGPFYLERMGTVAEQYAELRAFRDPSYPFKPEDFYVGLPEPVALDAPLSVEVGRGEELRVEVEAMGPGRLGAHFLLIDPSAPSGSRTLVAGEAERVGAKLVVKVPAEKFSERVEEGVYKLYIIAYSDEVSLVAEREVEVELVEALPTTATTTTPTTAEATETRAEAAAPPPLLLIVPIVLLAAAVAAAVIMRRIRKR